jgi:hypothetical protein
LVKVRDVEKVGLIFGTNVEAEFVALNRKNELDDGARQ